MKIRTTTWENGRVAHEVENFGTITKVEPINDGLAYLEVWDEAGLVERRETPMSEASDEARVALWRAYRGFDNE